MNKSLISFILKVLVITALTLSVYYFAYLKPKLKNQEAVNQIKIILYEQKNNLLQNKLAYIKLAQLDSKSANFDFEKNQILKTVKESSKNGLEALDKNPQIPKLNSRLDERFPQLLQETKLIYEDQNKLVDKIFSTKSYQEGLLILKSNESVKLLTRQTNLILEYDYWLKNI